jgi:hypothetical protein
MFFLDWQQWIKKVSSQIGNKIAGGGFPTELFSSVLSFSDFITWMTKFPRGIDH